MQDLVLHGETLQLLPEKAIWWPKNRTLILSDLHIGKILHFRKNGIQAPVKQIESELQRLASLLASYQPKEVIIVGDLFHSDMNNEWELFSSITKNFSEVKFILVRGNHDRMPTYVLRESNITSSTLLVREPFIFQHEPVHHPTLYCISGHIHPAVSLQGKARQRLRLACFYITPNYLLLPAFGQFTGSATVKPKSGDRIFAIAQNDIIEIKHHEKISV